MIAAVQQKLFPDMAACAKAWVDPHLGASTKPDSGLAAHYECFFPRFIAARNIMTLKNDTLLEMQRRMLRIRYFDERASKMVKRGEIPGRFIRLSARRRRLSAPPWRWRIMTI